MARLLSLVVLGLCVLASAMADEQGRLVEEDVSQQDVDKPKKHHKKAHKDEEEHHEYTVRPVIVDNKKYDEPVEVHDVKTHFNDNSGKVIDDFIRQKEEVISRLNKKLEETVRYKVELKLQEDLYKGVVGLKKTRDHLKAVDAAISKNKKKIKRYGEKASEIADTVKRSEAERKQEIARANHELAAIQKQLQEVQQKLKALVGKRQKFASNVSKWKRFVAVLKEAYEKYSVDPNAKAAEEHKHAAAAQAAKHAVEEYFPDPPSVQEFLASKGLPWSATAAAHLRGTALKARVAQAEAIVDKEIAAFAAAHPRASKHHSKANDEVPARVEGADKHRFAAVDLGIDVESEAQQLDLELETAEKESEVTEAADEALSFEESSAAAADLE